MQTDNFIELSELSQEIESQDDLNLDVGDGGGETEPPTVDLSLGYTEIETTYDGDAEGEALIFGESASEDYVDPSAEGETTSGGGDFILVDLVGPTASEIETADEFVFELEPSGDPKEPTEPDPGDAEGEVLIFGESASEDYVDPSAEGETTSGGGDFILVDLVGLSGIEPVVDDFMLG